MVRRKMLPVSMRAFIKSAGTATASRPRLPNAALAMATSGPSSSSTPATPSISYISDRINHVFNIILAEINHKNSHPSLSQHSPKAIYKDPYNFKDSILQDLVANADITTNYNIHDLIEEEFGLEISDTEFQNFKSLQDIVKYVNERLEIRHSLGLNGHGESASGAPNSNLHY